MGETVQITQYFCEKCQTTRNFKIDSTRHFNNIGKSRNGLAIYSDIHHCKDRITGVNNLRVDTNFDVRTFEIQELEPVREPPKFSIPGINGSLKNLPNLKNLYVSGVNPQISFRAIIIDKWLTTRMNFGVENPDTELPIQIITSDLGGLVLSFYESDIIYSANLEKWLYILINSLECLPPTRFGFVIETLRYVLNLHDQAPTNSDILLLRTILASHEIYFKATDDPNRFDEIALNLSEKIPDIDTSLFMELVALLELHPSVPLLEYIKTHDYDLEYLIYIFLILEKEGLIVIDRPGIVNV
ncbi:MAG: hypothetical protein GPJ54_04295 [Candidatus Heimdallarchaeota archaeon]|nr:hypothetical protein [Candidatus Heimdallarchaeota archaeon]